MEQNGKKPKTRLLIVGSIVAVVAVVYFSFFYPPVAPDEAQGTIGAAKKYRSQQISEGDVLVGGAATGNVARVALDTKISEDLRLAASDLAKSAVEMGSRATFEKSFAANLGQAAAAMARTAELARFAGMNKTVPADFLGKALQLSKEASEALARNTTLDQKAAAGLEREAQFLEMTATAANLGILADALASKSWVDNTASAGLQKTADMMARAAEFSRSASIDRQASAEFLGSCKTLESAAIANLGKNAPLEKQAIEGLGKSALAVTAAASGFEKSAGLERQANLEKASGLEKTAAQDK